MAANKADLLDGTIAATINRTESNVEVPAGEYVWTGMYSNFSADPYYHCTGWTSAGGTISDLAPIGRVNYTNGGSWTFENRGGCNAPRRLYCFER